MSENTGERVSLDKSATSGPGATQRPKAVRWVILALLLSGVLAVAASASLYGLHDFLLSQLEKANAKLATSKQLTHAKLLTTAHQQPTAYLIQSAILLFAQSFVATSVWRGRYWARWAVIGLWILSSLTGLYGGALQILYITQSSVPYALRIPVSLSSLSFLVAVGIVAFNKPLVAWLNLTRPARRTSGAPARRGLFTPRDPVRAARQGVSTASPLASRKVRETAQRTEDLFRGDANTERARAKQRMNAEAVQRGAAEARARAKSARSGASKSRRVSP